MKFGRIAIARAEGAILGHSVTVEAGIFKKGRRLSEDDVARLQSTGIENVIAARIEAGDVGEDEAAGRLAADAAGPGVSAAEPFAGRANLYATARGLLVYDRDRLAAVNGVDESITVAALDPFAHVERGDMVATIKIIPFAASEGALSEAMARATAPAPLIRVAPFHAVRAGLIVTEIKGVKEKVAAKTVAVARARIEALGGVLDETVSCPHDEDAIAAALAALSRKGLSPILVLAASAIVDRRDVIPAAIERAGGRILRFGMPVDPGNLLLLALLNGAPVVGLPGCARSPKLNGLDLVLERLFAGIPISSADIAAMGAGGLLKETAGRGLPREAGRGGNAPGGAKAPRLAAIVLAAGQSRRMGAANKLLAPVDGKPLLAPVVDAALASAARPVVVVTGHEAEKIEAALQGRDVVFVHNPDYTEGLSASLRVGIEALPAGIDGAFVCLGDMPLVTADHLRRLAAAFDPGEGRSICVPVFCGKRGNPVLWSAAYFAEMKALAGDTGARHLIGEHQGEVCEVDLHSEAVLKDVDTPADLRSLKE